jgi:Golgi phosphoprotein 3
MSSGLSRRRVAASGAAGTVGDVQSSVDDATSTLPSPSSPSHTNGSASYGGTALAGGNRVAFDPRDLAEQEQDGGKMPVLTLLDEVLLLGLKDKQVRS